METIQQIKLELAKRELVKRESAKDSLLLFTEYTFPAYQAQWFHIIYASILDQFIKGNIRKCLITMPPQFGKQFAHSTPVLTTSGWKTHGELKIGDFVYNQYGTPVQVQAVSREILCDTEIVFSDKTKLQTHSNHEWFVHQRGSKKIHKKSTSEIAHSNYWIKQKNGKYRATYHIIEKAIVQTGKKELLIDPYTLGLWLGDGKSASATFTLNKKDSKNIIKLLHSKWSDVRVHKESITTQNCYIPELHQLLKKEKLLNNKHIPESYITGNIQQRLQLLAGIIDSDGYVHKNGRYAISNTNKSIIDSMELLLESLNIRTTICKTDACISSYGIIGKKDVYQLTFNTDLCIPCILGRKRNKNPLKKKRKIGIKTINTIKGGLGRCIQVDGGVYLIGKSLLPTSNSELSTRRLPAMMLGRNNNLKGCVSSYNATKAREFSRDIQRIISDPEYYKIFPNTLLANNKDTVLHNLLLDSELNILTELKRRELIQTQEYFEVMNNKGKALGSCKAVGRGGSLTGNRLDFMVMDDLYKDYKEANSAVIRQNVIDWYISVVRSRFHNDSQELMVFTRWHPEDLIGYIEKEEKAELITTYEQITNPNPKQLYKINFPALATKDSYSELDVREVGESLWEHRHSTEKLLRDKKLDEEKFESLYQGNPKPLTGLLFPEGFKTYQYNEKPAFRYVYNYTDTADTGKDYLCSISYGVGVDDNIYVLDMVYTQEPQEITEDMVADLFKSTHIGEAIIESNNGGRAFARNVDRITGYKYTISWFHQSENKEARILSNSSNVKRLVYMPINWRAMWPEFAEHILGFKRNFHANSHDDCADATVGMVEHSGIVDTNMNLWS